MQDDIFKAEVLEEAAKAEQGESDAQDEEDDF
jgi:hypothetical protein